MPEMIGITDIAKRLRLDSGTVRRLIARESEALNLTISRGKGERLLLSEDDAERLISSYEARRGPLATYEPRRTPAAEADDIIASDRYGYFYIIQLIPEALPNRVKIGFSDNLEKRLSEHKTAAPTAKILKAWPCKRSWDYAAMDSITREGCKLVLNEVFEGEVNGFIERGDQFFAIMLTPDSERELSQYSPLYEASDDADAGVQPVPGSS